jgi:hypothetical protein
MAPAAQETNWKLFMDKLPEKYLRRDSTRSRMEIIALA